MTTNENNINYKIAVIGNELLCLGFNLLGTKKTYIEPENVEQVLKELIDDNEIGLIIISQKMSKNIKNSKLLNLINSSIKPLIIEIPDYNEQDKHQDNLRKLILRSIGIDVAI
ncbi:MAG: V-type ATP synthase subunit F [Candidatus Marsarchaeota archaeon]|nr:V-type ATP synthase subunit F [Candidatus Marsarchaeota archaeon]MCL5094885.1 V-type ATP synthase subunit F [Candidatus Marsarchaeota archaeon]